MIFLLARHPLKRVFVCSDEELLALFSGYGYQVRLVSNMDQIDEEMAVTMQWYNLVALFTSKI